MIFAYAEGVQLHQLCHIGKFPFAYTLQDPKGQTSQIWAVLCQRELTNLWTDNLVKELSFLIGNHSRLAFALFH